MMQKRTLYSLLLTSFILVFAFSVASAQNTVTVQSKTVARCQEANTVNIDVTNAASISAFEIILEVATTSGGGYYTDLDVQWDVGLTELTHRIVDLDGVDYTSPDTIRIAGMLIDPGDACLAAGVTTVAQVVFESNDVCAGTFDFTGADFNCLTACGCPISATTQFVDCATTTIVPATVTPGTVTIQNQSPFIVTPVPDDSIHWGSTYTGQINADDPDLHTVPGGCETLTYSLASGPSGMTVNATTGAIFWPTNATHICYNQAIVEVTDACGATARDTFDICVWNIPPEITCPDDTTWIVWSQTASGGVSAVDPDGGPAALTYSVASFSGPGTVNINPATGDWTWDTIEDNAYLGYHTLCIKVSDGAPVCPPCSPENADTCCVIIHVIPTIRVNIEKVHNVYQGHYQDVQIYLDDYPDPPNEMGGYDFLIDYDASALTFIEATPGQLITDCGWEYFTYRYGPNGNCGPNACPSGKLRIVAMAETNNGPNHPLCFVGDPHLATLTFLVTDNRTYECMYVPIRFIWYDCGDNTISSVTGDTLFMSRHVYDFDNPVPIEDPYTGYPTWYGAQADCDVDTGDGKPDPLRLIDFWNGGIDIICADSIDTRGDLNLNSIANEIADAVLYTNYFVYGLGVFTINVEGQTAASDVNADGIPLSVGDLVYLVRVIVGDASPYPKLSSAVDVNLTNTQGTLAIDGSTPMGAAFVVAQGQVTPQLLADNMEMKYAYDAVNDATRILVYSYGAESFTGEFVQVPGEIVSIEMATYQGYPVNLLQVPTAFHLAQNYPNPFNPTTTIAFETPTAVDYSLVVFNINGQEVARYDGSVNAGAHELEFDASHLGSGVYFYHLQAGSFSASKKMILVK